MTNLKGKYVLTTAGDVKPLFMTEKQWDEISAYLKQGAVPVTTNQGAYKVFAVLEIAKGYEGTGIGFDETGMMMLFNEQ